MNFIQRMMYGRCGLDPLSVFLFALYLLFYLLNGLTDSPFFSALSFLPLLLCAFRMFSRNLDKRRCENTRFMAFVGPAIRWCKLRRTMIKDKDHRYFKCPNCSQQLRVPRGKGKITVNCRNCGVSFEEKT